MSANTNEPKTRIGKVIDYVLRVLGIKKSKKGIPGSAHTSTSTLAPHAGDSPKTVVFTPLKQRKEVYTEGATKLTSLAKTEEVKEQTTEALIAEIAAYGVLFKAFQGELNGWASNPAKAFDIPKDTKLEEFQTGLKDKKGFAANKSRAKIKWHRIYWYPDTNNIFRYVPTISGKSYFDRSQDPNDKITLPSLKSPAEKMQHVMRCCFHSWRMSVGLNNPEAARVADNFLENVLRMNNSYVKYAFLKCMIDFLENLQGVNMTGLVAGSKQIQKAHTERGAKKGTRQEMEAALDKANFVKDGLPAAKQKEFQTLLAGKIEKLKGALKETEEALYKPVRTLKA